MYQSSMHTGCTQMIAIDVLLDAHTYACPTQSAHHHILPTHAEPEGPPLSDGARVDDE